MIDLEERFTEASRSVQEEVARIPIRPASEVARRNRRRTTRAYSAGLLATTALFAAIAMVLTGGPEPQATQPGDAPPLTYSLNAPEWELISVWESEDGSGTSHTLFDRSGSSTTPRRFDIETGSAAVDRAETLVKFGIEPITTFSFRGADVAVHDTDATAGAVAFASIVGLWTSPDGMEYAFLFETVDLSEVQGLVSRLEPVSSDEWDEMIANYEPPVSTTILSEDRTN